MKTKEEVIKEAYGEYWESVKDFVDENGFSINQHKDCQTILKENLSVEFMVYKDKIRPKSLQGIENNNGWIKIESEADFPKHSTYIETILKCYEINDPKAQGMHHFIIGDEKFLLEKISHYRVILFIPPIY